MPRSLNGPIWHVNGIPALFSANELCQIIITVPLDGRQWLQHISVYASRRSLPSQQSASRDEPRSIPSKDRSFLIGFDRRNLYGSLFWTNSTIKFLSFGNKLVNLDAFFFSKMRRSIHQRWMLEPIFGGLNLIKMDLGGLFLKDHLLRIDSIHQRWILELIFEGLNLV